jgi:hypothetical protein
MAACLVIPATACLLATNAKRFGTARMPPTDAAFTIAPDPWALKMCLGAHENTIIRYRLSRILDLS